MGDKAYSFAANRAYLRKRGITAVIPVKEDQKSTAGPAANPQMVRAEKITPGPVGKGTISAPR
jgi:hypothetical protein